MSFTTFNEVFQGDLAAELHQCLTLHDVAQMIRELQSHVFLCPIKVKNLDPGPAEPTPGAFSPVSSTLCAHEHIGTTVVTIAN
jgi:hypothetical protein